MPTFDTDDQLMTALTTELAGMGTLELTLRASSALHLAGLLQLALRHPKCPETSRAMAEQFLGGVRAYFAQQPAARELLRRGDAHAEPPPGFATPDTRAALDVTDLRLRPRDNAPLDDAQLDARGTARDASSTDASSTDDASSTATKRR